uniref:DUF6533 domain-containing protein n=1 Tax=Psilocybe cubensis TaxID=181762 RepID=A0A8H7XPW1_PSICU
MHDQLTEVTALLILEYCGTFEQEVERFWKVGGLSWASGFFYLNRYAVLLGHIPVMIEYFWSTSNPRKIQVGLDFYTFHCISSSFGALLIFERQICHQLQSYHQYFAVAVQILVSSMLIMRMYALYERSKRVLVLLLGVAVAAVAIGCWSILGGKKFPKAPEIIVPIGCAASLTHYQAVRLGAAWGGMLVFDFIIFGLTLYKSLSIPRTIGVSLISVLMRDGAIYFS